MSGPRRSSAERDAEARAQLVPLAPGERPRPLLAAIALLIALAIANLVAFVAGVQVDGRRASPTAFVVFEVLVIAGVIGLWQRRYLAVLAVEGALGITITIAALSLMVASNLAAVALCLGVMVLGGWLFWKLVRVMGRIQAPRDER